MSQTRSTPGSSLTELASSVGAVAGGNRGGEPGRFRTIHRGRHLRAQDTGSGDLFAALSGASSHGAQYARAAIDNGAVAILTDPDGVRILDSVLGGSVRVPVIVHLRRDRC